MNKENEIIKISLIGDILCDNSLSLREYFVDSHYDFDRIFSSCKEIFVGSDYVIGNLETPITKNYENLTAKLYEFNTPFEFAKTLKNIGVNFLTTANNHCLDRGISGLRQTISCLDELGLSHTGTFNSSKENNGFLLNVKGLNIGILSYTYGTNAFSNGYYLGFKNRKMVNLTQEQERWFEKYRIIKKFLYRHKKTFAFKIYYKLKIIFSKKRKTIPEYERTTIGCYRKRLLKKDIKTMNKKSDLNIAYLHIGGQYNYEPTQYTKKMINFLLKNGVNVVVGNHEHVVHGTKVLLENNKFATYAIGNFFSGAGSDYPPYDKLANYGIVVHTYIDKDTKSIKRITFSIIKTIKTGEGQFEVIPVYINPEPTTIKEALDVAYVFAGKKYSNIEKEFVLVTR